MAIDLLELDSAMIKDVDSEKHLLCCYPLNQISRNGGGIVTTSFQNNLLPYAFQIQKRFTITSGGSLDMVLDFSTATGKSIYGLEIRASSSSGECHLDTYIADSYTGGTELTPLAADARTGNVALATVKTGVTPTGESNTREYTIGTGSTNQSSGGGVVSDVVPKTFNNVPLIFHFENQESDTTTITLGYTWYELDTSEET